MGKYLDSAGLQHYTDKLKDGTIVAGKAEEANKVKAANIEGTIPLEKLPAGALERLAVVADDTARLALTTATVQNGDTVKVESTGKMYFVVDDTKLSTEAGYKEYSVGSAVHADSADNGSCGCRCGLDVEAVELTTELQIPSLGKGVIHVYNIARSVWGNGLDSDGETVSVKVAEDSADVLSVDRDGLHIDKEAIGTGGGTAVTPEEIDEIMGIINSGQENRKANEVNYPETKDFGASWADQSNL